MEQDKKNSSGAPSSDTTSALFVSARKKQLEQQEAEQRAKEKEEQRLAAEAEVRRLEAEVEERRRKAAEDAKLADEEAKRIAEESRQKKAEAADNPDSVLGAASQKKETKLPQMPKFPKKEQGGSQAKAAQGGGIADLLKNKMLLGIAGGGVAAIVLVIVLVVTLGGGSKAVTKSGADFSGIWYSGTTAYYDTIEFFDKGKCTLTFMTGEVANGTYKVDGEKITVDLGEPIVMGINGNTMFSYDDDLLLTRELEDSVNDYAISGYFHIIDPDDSEADESYSFSEDGSVLVDDTYPGTYVVEGGNINVTYRIGDTNYSVVLTIQDDDTLIDDIDYVFKRAGASAGKNDNTNTQDSAPTGYAAFSDPDTGLSFFYPSDMGPGKILNDDALEITSLGSGDGIVVSFCDVTESYDDLVATANYRDFDIVRALARGFMDDYTPILFGSDWTLANGSQDIMSGVEDGFTEEMKRYEGRNYTTLSAFVSAIYIDDEMDLIYAGIHEFPDTNLKVFVFAFIDAEQESMLEEMDKIVASMRITKG